MKRKTNDNRFGKLLRTHRRRLDITLKQLGEKCGLHNARLSRIEHGSLPAPPLPIVIGIAGALGFQKGSREWNEFVSLAIENRTPGLDQFIDLKSPVAPRRTGLAGLPQELIEGSEANSRPVVRYTDEEIAPFMKVLPKDEELSQSSPSGTRHLAIISSPSPQEPTLLGEEVNSGSVLSLSKGADRLHRRIEELGETIVRGFLQYVASNGQVYNIEVLPARRKNKQSPTR